jgi:hypothetical protein
MSLLAHADNPILWQEFIHQERSTPRWLQRGSIIGVVILALFLGFIVLTFSATPGYPTTLVMLYAIWILHTATALRAIIAGANVISREHVAQTWDALALTGVNAQRILFGKWRAALRHVRGWMLLLGILRLAALPIFSVALAKTYAYYTCGIYSYSGIYGCDEGVPFILVPWAVLTGVIMTVVLTILDVMCCTAIGMAASALTRRGTAAAIVAILVRFMPVLIFAGFARFDLGSLSWRWWLYTPFALADSGTSPLMQLVYPVISWTQGRHVTALLGLALAAGMLLMFLVISLGASLVMIRRAGALPTVQKSV